LDYYSYNPLNYSIPIEPEYQKQIILQGLYEMNGQILVLPIMGNGRCKISLGAKKIFFDIHFQLKFTLHNLGVFFFEDLKLTGILQITKSLKKWKYILRNTRFILEIYYFKNKY